MHIGFTECKYSVVKSQKCSMKNIDLLINFKTSEMVQDRIQSQGVLTKKEVWGKKLFLFSPYFINITLKQKMMDAAWPFIASKK